MQDAVYLPIARQNATRLQELPTRRRMKGVCLAAVQIEGRTLEFVPDRWKTPDVCLAAVKQNGHALRVVPENLKVAVRVEAEAQVHGKSALPRFGSPLSGASPPRSQACAGPLRWCRS